MEEEEIPMLTNELVAYRLGRVEKAVDANNLRSVERDDKILIKLEQLGELTNKVSEHSYRLNSLEGSRTNIYRFIMGIGTAVFLMVMERILDLI